MSLDSPTGGGRVGCSRAATSDCAALTVGACMLRSGCGVWGSGMRSFSLPPMGVHGMVGDWDVAADH